MIMMIIEELENDDDKIFIVNLYRGYYGLVRKTVYNITNDWQNVEDLIEDTFVKLIGKISLLRTLDNCKIAAYIVYTSRSVAINVIKRRDVERKHVYYGLDTDLAEAMILDGDTIENRIIQEEEIKAMRDAILKLPEKEKELLYFKYILEMDNSELAEIFGIAPASVRQYLTRARRKAQGLRNKEVGEHAE